MKAIFSNIEGTGDERQLSKKGRRIFGVFGVAFGSLFLVAGIGVMYAALNRGLNQRSTSSWFQTPGTVLEFNSKRAENEKRSSPIAYRYEVDGKTYRSDRVAFVDKNNIDYNDWLRLVNGLPESGAIQVFYNPQNPEESVLKTGDYSTSWDGLGFGAGFAGFAAFWMVGWWAMSNWLPDKLQKETVVRI
jgi:Protein of unknown function (DUF3592)